MVSKSNCPQAPMKYLSCKKNCFILNFTLHWNAINNIFKASVLRWIHILVKLQAGLQDSRKKRAPSRTEALEILFEVLKKLDSAFLH